MNCVGSWSPWPGNGSGRCEYSLGAYGAGAGVDDDGRPYAHAGGQLSFWRFTFEEPCTQVDVMPPLGVASGYMFNIWNRYVHADDETLWIRSTEYQADFNWVRVGTAIVIATSNASFGPMEEGQSSTAVTPGGGLATWIPENYNPTVQTCANPGDLFVSIVGAYGQPA